MDNSNHARVRNLEPHIDPANHGAGNSSIAGPGNSGFDSSGNAAFDSAGNSGYLGGREPGLHGAGSPPGDTTRAPAHDGPAAPGHLPAAAPIYSDTDEMPAWLREPQAKPPLLARYGRPMMVWSGVLVMVGVVAAGGLWLQGERDTHSELQAIANSSRAADAAVIGSRPPLPPRSVVPERRTINVPPLVTLPPEEVPAGAVPSEQAGKAKTAAKTGPREAARPARKAARAKTAIAKSSVRRAVKAPERRLSAAEWPPAPSRKMPLAQNVVPKPVAASVNKAASMKVASRKVASRKAAAAAKARRAARLAKARREQQVAGVMLPPPKPRAVTLPVPRQYASEPAARPRGCPKGALARECLN